MAILLKNWGCIVLILVTSLLVACGNSSEDKPTMNSKSEQDSTANNHSITIKDGEGEVTTIDGVPKKVVVLEWTYVEHMLPLGVEPVGVADVEGYNKWVNVGEPLSNEVEDVGTRSEPNFEAIARLNPDLIIGAKYRHESFKDQLGQIAPTVLFAPYSEEGAAGQYQHLIDEFKTIANIFNKEEKASEVIDNLETSFKEQGNRIKEAGIENSKAVVTQAFTSQNTPTLRLFTDNSVVAGVLEHMGLNNAVETENPEIYGFISTTVEGLQNYQNAHFFYLVQKDDPILENLGDNPAWTNLDFVENNHTYKLPGDIGTFAGPLSAERLAEEIANKITE